MYMKVTSNFDHCTASQQTQPLNKTMKFRGSTFLLHVVNMSVTKMVYSRRCMQELMQCREVLISSCPNITRVHKLLVGVTTTSSIPNQGLNVLSERHKGMYSKLRKYVPPLPFSVLL